MLAESAKPKAVTRWITLFDDITDDLYDGSFEEDDPETPMVQLWFRKIEDVSKTIVKTTITTTTIIERNSAWSVQTLKTDLSSKVSELIYSLKDDQKALFQEEEDRIKTLASLDQAHEELKGEHANDLADGKKITEKQKEIKDNISKRKQDIEQQKKNLQTRINDLSGTVKKLKEDLVKAEQENKRLQKIVDTPEDLKEKGLTQDAKKLRDENEKLRKQQDGLTTDLLKERDARNTFINDHRNLVQEYNKNIEKYNTNLLGVAQDVELTKTDFNQAGHQLVNSSTHKDKLSRAKQLTDEDITLKKALLEQLKKDYESTDKTYSDYLDLLRNTSNAHLGDISGLNNSLNERQASIRDLTNQLESYKIQLSHFTQEIDA